MMMVLVLKLVVVRVLVLLGDGSDGGDGGIGYDDGGAEVQSSVHKLKQLC